jgi:hypothetical protein
MMSRKKTNFLKSNCGRFAFVDSSRSGFLFRNHSRGRREDDAVEKLYLLGYNTV